MGRWLDLEFWHILLRSAQDWALVPDGVERFEERFATWPFAAVEVVLPAWPRRSRSTAVAKTFLKYARLLAARGYIHNTLGNIGRNVSEAYHRLNSLVAEVRRNITAELLAAAAGTQAAYRSEQQIQGMYRFAESIIYPKRAEKVMHEDL